MTERYPDDAALLALERDEETGLEYIPTGLSPYFLQFRRMLQRLLLAARRANDLRVYQDGDLTIGVRGGRCVIGGSAVAFGGAEGIGLPNNATVSVWLDAAGAVQTGSGGLPADRTSFVPLAEVVTDAGTITEITDLRGEAFLAVADLSLLGVTAGALQINQALDGIGATVDAAALNALTGGPTSTADTEHRHEQVLTDSDAEMELRLINASAGASANIALRFDLPNRLPGATDLLPDAASGFLRQRHLGEAYALVGTVHAQFRHEGDLTASQSGKLIGVVPADGVVSDVILSAGRNIESDTAADGVAATVKVNETAVTSTDPALSDADGAGFRSTAQAEGTAAVVKSDGTEQVSRGDVLTLDLTRTVAGVVSQEPSDVVVLVVIRADRPE